MKPSVPGRVVLAAALAATAWTLLPPSSRPGAAAVPGARSPGAAPEYVGVASCTASACHNANGPRGSKGSEYTTWLTCDRHARAYSVLLDQRSRIIEKNLLGLADLKEARPENDRLCLRCHALDLDPAVPPNHDLLADGVSCENCHGPARQWLAQHYTAEWKGLSTEQKQALGMWPTKDLVQRADACARCHVGAEDREVNHDLIAAGHPRLNFEYAAYLANMPKHWPDERQGRPDFEARVWLIGQVTAAEAALRLLETRAAAAEKSTKSAPWPEFAEYDCYACHHGLRDQGWRRQRDFSQRDPGSYPWGTWYTALLPAMAQQWPGEEAERTVGFLRELEKLMSQPLPDAGKVAQQAGVSRQQLRNLRPLVSAPVPPEKVHELLVRLAQSGGRMEPTWDTATQLYLALVALHQAQHEVRPSPADRGVAEGLYNVRLTLEFPRGENSPATYNAEAFRARLGDLQKLIR